ncbi:MAG: DUF4974 domain-containing protein [Tannerellaceae bacterium]|nr:DUF4974 domain-containing protein [Tannerellaceae bacterium]
MKQEKEYIDELIIAYLTNELDKEGLNQLKEWLAASAENETRFLQQQEVWFSALEENKSKYNSEKAFKQFKDRIAGQKSTSFRSYFSKYGRYAAAVILLCMVSYFSYWRGEVNVKNGFAMNVIEAPLGSITKLSLPDGTLVWLNAGSKIAYSQGFGVDNRNIQLDGEGYFEVIRNREMPFWVKTENLELQVLGTKFNFRDYPDDEEVIVSLSEGKVALTNLLREEDAASLSPNERAVLNKKSGAMHVESTVVSIAQWTSGQLLFDEDLLPDIIKELERSYDVEIEIANESLHTVRFYGNFTRRKHTIEDVLDALSATRKIEYVINGRNITLY